MTTFLSQVAQITPSLYLSGFIGANEQNVKKYRVSCIITVCKEIPKLYIPSVESIKLDVLDRPNEQLDRYFDFVADRINEVEMRKNGGSTLVHCVAGISRSASMCIAYLMKYHKLSLRDAYSHVKSKRQFIRPNLGFWMQLFEYERKLFGVNSIEMLQTSFGLIPDVYESEFKNMIVPNAVSATTTTTTNNNTTTTTTTPASAPIRKSISTATITLNNNNTVKVQQQQNDVGYEIIQLPSKPLSSLAFTAQLRNNLTANANSNNKSTPYTTTYSSSYGTILRR